MIHRAPVHIRDATVDDSGFIANAWLHSYRRSYDGIHCAPHLFDDIYRPLVDGLMRSCHNDVVCGDANESQLFGFVNYVPDGDAVVINYIYVKGAFRGLGFARAMFDRITQAHGDRVFATHLTRDVQKYRLRGNFVYAPTVAAYFLDANRKHSAFGRPLAVLQGTTVVPQSDNGTRQSR
jgi:hypothetical protein